MNISVIIALIRGLFYRLRYRGRLIIHKKLRGGIKCYKRSTIHLNKKSHLHIGKQVSLYPYASISVASNAHMEIGNRTFFNKRCEIICKEKIVIGNDCAISWNVTIMDTDYHSINGQNNVSPVYIGNHVWICCHSVILKGVKIGNGAIVAAGSIVTRDVPPNSIVAGSPAQVIKNNITWSLH